MNTIPGQFKETAKKFPKKIALKFKYHNAYIGISFAELQKRVEIMAKGLLELGVGRSDRLAILSENRSEWVRADLAALSLGAIVVPIHTSLSSRIIQHILNDSGATTILVSNQDQLNKIILAINDLPILQTIIYINLDHPENYHPDKKFISLTEVMRLGEKSSQKISADVGPDDIASIVYTSGTTDLPKGVMLSHGNFLFDAEAAVTAVPVDHHDVLLSFLPLSHVLERTAGYYAPLVCRGCCIAYAESLKTLPQNLKEIKPTILVSVPRIFEKIHSNIWDTAKKGGRLKYKIFLWALKQEPKTLKYRLADLLVFHKIRAKLGGRFRLTISGGASLNQKLGRFFDRIGIKIVQGYGLTETAPVVTVNRPNDIKFGTVGPHLPGVQISIAADKEILVSGPNLMKGYYNNEEKTKEVIDEAGWFHTGDLGFVDDEGFLTIIGRKKEMISMSNGKIVWPEQLELILNGDRLISQSMVVGDNKKYLSALLIPDWPEVMLALKNIESAGQEPDELIKDSVLINIFQQRINDINEQLADWEKIRRFILLSGEFSQNKDEVTPTLKLRRKVIEYNYKKKIEEMYK